VWKTTTGGGYSWTPVADNLPALAIAAIAIDPSNICINSEQRIISF
jgi:hypothetical protein